MSDTKINIAENHPEQRELRYEPERIEEKWHGRWESDPALYAAEPHTSKRKKYYVLEMLPYPSGALHMGHVRNYAIGDALARFMWMSGYNVLHPMGWDAFGLPAENAAIKNNVPPREWTLRNIAHMLETAFATKPREWTPLVYCWRGGKRSGALTHVLNEIGWRAVQLDGGYRAFRRHVRASLETLPAALEWLWKGYPIP